MPGIFGAIAIDKAADRSRLSEARDRIGGGLQTFPEYATEVHDDPGGRFAIGRTGLAHLHQAAWPSRSAGAEIFATGHPLAGSGGVLQGFYAAVRATRDGPITIEADRAGTYRVYFAKLNGLVVFAPEIGPLLELGIPKTLDLAAFGTFLSSGLLYREQTLLSEVRRLPGGARLVVDDGRARLEEVWRFAPGSTPSAGVDQAGFSRELAELMRASARRHAAGAEDALVFLSGGADSRAILAALRLEGVSPLDTVTWGDFDAGPTGDVAVAEHVARSFDVPHALIWRDLSQFGVAFARSNALAESEGEIVAEHPFEFGIMERLRRSGHRRVFRGDTAFGWERAAHTFQESWRRSGLRRLKDLPQARALIAPAIREQVVEASETVFDRVRSAYAGMSPDQAKDALYFDIRLPGYLQPARYWRQALLDERNILLDDPIIDFLTRVPDAIRTRRELFLDAADILAAAWTKAPYATASNLAPLADQLSPDQPAGAYIRTRLSAPSDSFFELIDRDAATDLLASFDRKAGGGESRAKFLARNAKRALSALSPGMAERVALSLKRSSVPRDPLARRLLVLRDWHDRFLAPGN